MKVTIGICSYFPDEENLRGVRIARLNNLIKQCNDLFGLPIMIIAQNWKSIAIAEGMTKAPIYVYKYDKPLGITQARRELKTKFLESDFDYLVMLDDDSYLKGTKQGAQVYLYDLLTNPDKFGVFKPSLIKLFAISKEVFKLIEYPEGGADDKDENKRYFEDMYLTKALQKVYPEKEFKFHRSELMEYSDSAWDEYSTGWHEVYAHESEGGWNRHDTGDQTRGMIVQATPKKLLHPERYDRTKKVTLQELRDKYGIN